MTSNNIIPIGQARMPAAMKARLQAGVAVNKNYAEGVYDSFPRLSIKGKNFALRVDGDTKTIFDPLHPGKNIPLNYLDVVLVNASDKLSKAYYKSDFADDGDFTPPDCWSLDSIKPDASVVDKVNPTCLNCPMNAFGSAQSRDGTAKAGKACQDARRIAVIFQGQIGQDNPRIFMLRVPQTSLKNLKRYAELLQRQGWDIAACVTRLTFEAGVAYPKLDFNFVDGLADDEYDYIVDLAEGDFVKAMLKAPDFDNAATQKADEQAATPAETPRTRQAMPIIGDEQAEPAKEEAAVPPRRAQQQGAQTQQTTPPVQRKPDLKAVEPVLIELPDGKLFNPATNEFVERAAPAVDMPSIDPNTIVLPDGRFFNKTTNTFVTGQELGAKAFVPDELPTRRKPAVRKKAAEKPAPETVDAVAETAAEPAETEASADAGSPQDSQPVENGKGNGAATISPAPAGLDALLSKVIPKKPAASAK